MRSAINYCFASPEQDDQERFDFALSSAADNCQCTIKKIKRDEVDSLNDDDFITVVSGGDGSLHHAVNWLADKKLIDRSIILYYPNGTGNDFARSVGLFDIDHKKITQLPFQKEPRTVSLGKFDDHYFINMATIGMFAEITPQVDKGFKNILGRWSYYVKGLEKLSEIEPIKFNFQIDDGEKVEREAIGFFVGNARFSGGGVQVTPDAKLDDEWLDMLVIEDQPVSHLVSLGLELQKPEPDLSDHKVLCKKIKSLHFASEEKVHINLDGENQEQKDGMIRLSAEKVRMFLPS